MVVTHYREDGFCDAWAEYYIVNQDGSFNEQGIYAFVRELWIHPTAKQMKAEFIKQEHIKYPQVRWLYFERRKHNRIRIYPIEWLYKRRKF